MIRRLEFLLQEMTEITIATWEHQGLAKYDTEKVGQLVVTQFSKAPFLIRLAVYTLLLPLDVKKLFRNYLTDAQPKNTLIKVMTPVFSYITCLIALSSEGF